MVTLILVLGNRLAKAATLTSAIAFLLVSVTSADAQGRRAHLSADLQKHLDAGDSGPSTVILSGTSDQIAAIAARHSLRIRRLLTSGAVVDVPAGGLDALAGRRGGPAGLRRPRPPMGRCRSPTPRRVPIRSGQAGYRVDCRGWLGPANGFTHSLTGRNTGVAILDSGVTIVAELRGQVRARVDMIDPKGSGADEWGHGTHVAGIIAGCGNRGIQRPRHRAGRAPGECEGSWRRRLRPHQ
jgi:hypothetical protein